MTEPFWKTKTLAEMTRAEWESLCDGCGRCCLNKLEEEVTNRLYFTDVGCRLLDPETCRCRNYKNRRRVVHDCVQLTPMVQKPPSKKGCHTPPAVLVPMVVQAPLFTASCTS